MLLKILIVDDSTCDRLIIKYMLSGYNVLTACDGIEAMRQIYENPDIDLLILDLNLPDMDGFAVLETLKSDERYKNLHTIILTNYDEPDNEIKGLKLGAVDYIRKPIHKDSLKARIDIHIELIRIQHLYEQKLYEQGITFDTIFNQAPIGIAISHNIYPFNFNHNIVTSINTTFEQITGRTKEELIALGWANITHPDDLEADIENFNKLQSGEINSYSMDKRYIKPDGSVVWVHMIVAPLTLSNDSQYNHICLVQNISDRKEMENSLRYINEHDRWTGLYNRRYLEYLLNADARKNISYKRAVVGINLSTFYSLTAAYGFHYTQDIIKNISYALITHCNDKRLLFSTYENRFVFYIKNYKDKNELIEFCNSVVKTLESILVMERIGGAIDVVEINHDLHLEADQLLKNLLLTSEKAINVNDGDFRICFYDDEIELQIIREQKIRNELTKIAADEQDGGLFLQYQPILDLKSNRISGFEALARLNSEDLGLVPPMEFIPLAEKTKLIIPLGEKIIRQALSFLDALKQKGVDDISVSINISAIQLLKKGFVKRLFEIIHEMQVDPENINLEITESVFASNYQEINNIIGELRAFGVKIAIDDFGTQYSSLSRQSELNINCLKIDKYFINKLLEVGPEKTIIGDIISMAHKLGHFVVVEGIEHEKQLEYLRENDCDKIQGYLMSKPLDKEDAIELLNKQPGINNFCHINDRQS